MEFISNIMTAFQDHLVTTIVVGVFGVASWLLNKLLGIVKDHLKLKREMIARESEEQGLLKQGMLALLRFRINRLCYEIKENGYLTIEQKQDLDDMFKAYTALGGNGRTHIMYEQIAKLPIN